MSGIDEYIAIVSNCQPSSQGHDSKGTWAATGGELVISRAEHLSGGDGGAVAAIQERRLMASSWQLGERHGFSPGLGKVQDGFSLRFH